MRQISSAVNRCPTAVPSINRSVPPRSASDSRRAISRTDRMPARFRSTRPREPGSNSASTPRALYRSPPRMRWSSLIQIIARAVDGPNGHLNGTAVCRAVHKPLLILLALERLLRGESPLVEFAGMRAAEFPLRYRFGVTGLQRPGIKNLGVRREIPHVAGNDGEAVALGGGNQEAIHHRQGVPGQFRVRGDLRPDVERGGIERQDAFRKALLHIAQPGGDAAPVAGAQLEDALFDLAQAD